jgi:hypothetical protein
VAVDAAVHNDANPREHRIADRRIRSAHAGVMISDENAIRNRDLIGVDKIMWEADFPHNDSNWPDSRIAEDNARAFYGFPRS